ncbi:MAG: DUF2974 domain-containing protein [Oscillospiraceae bacterium]|nr:DUF2974 domain-containing protein [Oscillospiraceae bacterium]
MDTLADYIIWMGDYPFSLIGMQDADALVLCLLSYIDLRPAFAAGETRIRLNEIEPAIRPDRAEVMITGDPTAYRRILGLAARSKRFGELLLSDYTDVRSTEPPLQFSAVCFHAQDWSFLAYRGTDNSFSGWKEDFMISFTRTEAQSLAAKTAEVVITPGRKWYMGGHSKGGNEVLYAACMLPDDKWSQVERVFLLDGPGLCAEVCDLSSFERIDARTTRIIPEYCVIGKLFEPPIRDTRIVRSTASGILQHGIATWGIDHGKPYYTDKNDQQSIWLSEVLALWISEIKQDERPLFVDELFDALSSGGAVTIDEFHKNEWENWDALLKQLKVSSDATKRTISNLPKTAIAFELEQLKERLAAYEAEREARRSRKT